MAVKHSTQGDFAARLLILLRCEDAPIHGLEELEAELALQHVVKRPVWTTRDHDGIHLNKTGPMDALELGVLIARRYANHQCVEFVMRRDVRARKIAEALSDALSTNLDESELRQLQPQIDQLMALYGNVIGGLAVYPKMIQAHLDEELPFFATENILMHCVKKGGDRQALRAEHQQGHDEIGGDARIALRRILGRQGEILLMLAHRGGQHLGRHVHKGRTAAVARSLGDTGLHELPFVERRKQQQLHRHLRNQRRADALRRRIPRNDE